MSLLAIKLFEHLPRLPLVTMPWVVSAFGSPEPTASRAIDALVKADVLVEITGKNRDRVYAYQAYLVRLQEGTEFDEGK